MKKRIILAYAIGIHMLLGVVLLKSDFIQRVQYKLGVRTSQSEITDHFHRMLSYHSRMDGNVPNQSVIFIGDSITQGLCVTAVANPSVNYGVGNDTTVGVLQRLPVYRSLEKASAVVIAIGINDMRYRSNDKILYNYRSIADKISLAVPVIFSAVLPIDEDARDEWQGVNNRRIKELNSKLKDWTETSARLRYVDAGSRLVDERGNLADELYDNDGVHLNSLGNAIWIQQLRESVNDAQQRNAARRPKGRS
jgi:lysophospholipase L1-like esterase